MILLGDFNDEPFDLTISEHVFSTRDRNKAKRKKELFYNPFWRSLGNPKPLVLGEKDITPPGTYFHKSGVGTNWRTFDQLIFSSNFLKSKDWFLIESETKALYDQLLLDKVKNRNEIFDHLPVIGVIERDKK